MSIRDRVRRYHRIKRELALGLLIDLYELGVDVGEEIVDAEIALSL